MVAAARVAVAASLLLLPVRCLGQTVTGEVEVTAGASTDEVTAIGTQMRLFGASGSDWRYYAEATWAGVQEGSGSDAFLASYPYDERVRTMEAFGEKMFRPNRGLLSIRGGRYRTPFGIYARSEQGYMGFLRAPLLRYGRNFALANTFLETGAEVVVGIPAAQFEFSAGVPGDQGPFQRRDGFDQVARAQAYFRGAIIGASYLRSLPSDPRPFATGHMTFGGVDGRWMLAGVELRGEWIDGRPFDHVSTRGGYLDAIVHNPRMGPLTALARVERLDYDAGPFSAYFKRLTAGGRLRLTTSISAAVNLVLQPETVGQLRDAAMDVAVTFSRRF
jgi:hypothetical protein